MDRMAYYGERRIEILAEVYVLKRRDRRFSTLRLAWMLALLAGLYFAWNQGSALALLAALTALTFFVLTLVRHQKLRAALRYQESLLGVIDTEIAYLKGDFSKLDPGDEFIDESHLFASDLDLFGKGSLFQRVNRSKGVEAKSKLAKAMLNLAFDGMEDRQGGLEELRGKADWCLGFRAEAADLPTGEVSAQIRLWLLKQENNFFLLKGPVLWMSTMLMPTCIAALAISNQWQLADMLFYPFLLNLFLFGSLVKGIRREQEDIESIHGKLRVYFKLMERIVQGQFDSPVLIELQSRLKSGSIDTPAALKKLAGLLQQLDSMNNVFGAALLNGGLQYHLHVFRGLRRWKAAHGTDMLTWLQVVHEMQVSISLAQYAFNHPKFEFPSLVEQRCFEANQLAHPFLPEGKRVSNDLEFDGFRWIILTGSNMAGKSTFLRSVGLSVVMASLGLPVCARSLKLSPTKLLTSMKPQDSINENRSYFQAEVLRLRAIMDVLESNDAALALFDEILRGTNSQDKRNGTMRFLEKIKDYNALGIIATHDIEIADITGNHPTIFRNMYFESRHEGQELCFDYVLRPGICTTPNASELLKRHGII